MSDEDQEAMNGYLDGHDLSSPEPSANRTWMYRHSFAVGRREAERKPPIPAQTAREMAEIAAQKDREA